MESYIQRETLVKDTHGHLSHYLHDAYPPEVPYALRNEYNCLPGAILFQVPVLKFRLE